MNIPDRLLYRRTLLVFLSAFLLLGLMKAFERPNWLEFEARSSEGGIAEIFYRSRQGVFSEEYKSRIEIHPRSAWHKYKVELERGIEVAAIRIDPPSSGMDVRGVVSAAGDLDWPAAAHSPHQLRIVQANEYASLVPLGDDPHVELPSQVAISDFQILIYRVLCAAVLAALFLAGYVLQQWLQRRLNFSPSRMLERGRQMASDNGVLVVSPRVWALLWIIAGIWVLYVGLKLHQSSIGVWEEIYPAHPVSQLVDIGTPKRIRSDEWNTQTPWVLNQELRGPTDASPNIGGGQASLLAAVPTGTWLDVLQPKFIGFSALGIERGFSWWWAYKTIGMFVAWLWLFLILTKGDAVLSIAGALLIYISSFTQWWLSSNLPEIMIGFAVAIIGSHYFFLSGTLRGIMFGAFCMFFSAAALLLHLYPPFILPLAFLGVATIVGNFSEPAMLKNAKTGIGVRSAIGIILLLASSALIILFFMKAGGAIDAMRNTVYPGNRSATSGAVGWLRIMSGWFEHFRFGEQRFPSGLGNASEAGGFVFLAPLVVFLVSFRGLFSRENMLLLSLACYVLLVTLWASAPLPAPINKLYQLSGWYLSPPQRSIIGIGLASIMLYIVALSRLRSGKITLNSPLITVLGAAACLLIVVAIGVHGHVADSAFYTYPVVVAGSLTAALSLLAVIVRQRWPVFVVIGLMAIPAFQVNPLVSGLTAISDKPLLKAARDADPDGSGRWVVFGDFVLSQGLKATGLDVASGSHMLPVMEYIKVLDPANRYVEVWNRYAHVQYISDSAVHEPIFELKQPDFYAVRINVCGSALHEIGVTHVAYTMEVPESDRACLSALPTPADVGIKLFRLKK